APAGAGRFESYFDVGFSLFNSSGGGTATGYQVTANLQHNSPSTGGGAPYLTVGGGMLGQTYSQGDNIVNPIAGGGIGFFQTVSRGHGAVRGELRYDYIFENSHGFAGGSLVGLKFGFDLYMK